jgi:hypothetical protein
VIGRQARGVGLAGVLSGVLLVATGCATQPSSGPTRTVVVTHTPTQAAPTGPTAPSTASSASASATPVRKLPGRCSDLLPLASIDTALSRSVHGKTAFVVGVAEKKIGRLSYLNCRYGLGPGGKGTAKAEIGVSLYTTPAQAAARIPDTVDDYVNHGAHKARVAVGGHTGVVLTGGSGKGYTLPTLVVASGQRTVAVTMDESGGARAKRDLTALATLALKRTAPN